ncbi:hypothetical protein LIER_34333 [Lithospermum erythrorhizon]|uniref:Uncharacterized protein n=1 Tax=Lithospermum erythrorhizon TaxID=34254 RepID=A0AAV3S1K8_LITER
MSMLPNMDLPLSLPKGRRAILGQGKLLLRRKVLSVLKSTCYTYNKKGHESFECKQPKKFTSGGNFFNVVTKGLRDVTLSDVISEVNLVDSNSKEWWIDIGTTRKLC